MTADEFKDEPPCGNPSDPCPQCNQAELAPFGGKLRCPACYYIQPCCNP